MIAAWSPLLLASLLLHVVPVLNLVTDDTGKSSTREHGLRRANCAKTGAKNSYLWTLENYPSVYIFGSIHRPYTTLWPKIPRNVKKAFKSSKKLYVEIDVTNPATVLTISNCMYLTNHQTLVDVLPMRVYEKLRKYLQYFKSQIPKWLNEISETKGKLKVENPNEVFEEMTKYWQLKRPIWILLMLNSFNKETVETRAIPQLDGYMYLKARQTNKTIGYLESAEERCRLSYLNSSQTIMYLDEMLTEYNRSRREKHHQSPGKELTYQYLCGNLSDYIFSSAINAQTSYSKARLKALRSFEDLFTEEFFLRRNVQMAKKMMEEIRLSRDRRMFFAVGAGHLVGNNSIIEILKSKGFKPRHILATDSLQRSVQKYKRKNKNSNGKNERKVAKSLPTITSKYRETEQSTEGEIVGLDHWCTAMNIGVRSLSNVFATFFFSWIVFVVINQ